MFEISIWFHLENGLNGTQSADDMRIGYPFLADLRIISRASETESEKRIRNTLDYE